MKPVCYLPGGAKLPAFKLAASCLGIVSVVFGVWLLVERVLLGHFEDSTIQVLHLVRGVSSSLLLGIWAAWFVARERKKHEALLQRSRDRYQGILNSTPAAVILFNENFRVVEWNEAATRLFGLSIEDAIGQHLPTIPPERWLELREMLASAQKGTPVIDVESQRRNVMGERLDVSVSLVCFREPDDGEAFFLEVTEDIRARVELRRRMLEIEKLTLMGRMAAGVAHHLNTPLAAIILRIGMLRKKVQDREALKELDKLEAKIKFCQEFVQELLQFARRPEVVKRPENLCEQISSIVAFLLPTLKMNGARVEAETSAARGVKILADRSHLEALFSVLLMNAADAIPADGTIRVHASTPRASEVEVRIEDNGCGISPQHLPRIFEPFYTTKESGRGTGLGMAIAQNIVQDHGGSIEVRSEPHAGTTVILRFPRLPLASQTGGVGQRTESLLAPPESDLLSAA